MQQRKAIEGAGPAPGGRAGPIPGLTPRQEQIALMVARGLTNPEIAEELNLSVFTVRNDLVKMLRKLGLSHRSQIAFAVGNSGRRAPRQVAGPGGVPRKRPIRPRAGQPQGDG